MDFIQILFVILSFVVVGVLLHLRNEIRRKY